MSEDYRARYVGKLNPWKATEMELIALDVIVKFLADNTTQKGKVVSWFPDEVAEATTLHIGITKNALELGVRTDQIVRGIFKQGKRKRAAYRIANDAIEPTEAIREPKERVENQDTGWKTRE